MTRRISIEDDMQHNNGKVRSIDRSDKSPSNTKEDLKNMRTTVPFNSNGKGKDAPILMSRRSAGRGRDLHEIEIAASHHIEPSDTTSTRTASFFRLSRASFSTKKKAIGRSASNESASPAPTTSFESQRSTTSAGSSNGPGTMESRIQSQTSSPMIYRRNHSNFWPHPSISSSREGEWISDMDGNRESSDLDSLTGRSGRPWLRMDRSSTSLSSDSIAEDSEMMDTFQSANTYASSISPKSIRPPRLAAPISIGDSSIIPSSARLKPSRSISAFTIMKRIGSEDAALSKMKSKRPLHHTPSTPSLRDHYNLPLSRSPLPPLPNSRSPRTLTIQEDCNHMSLKNRDSSADYKMQRDSLMVPSSNSSSKTLRKTKSQNSFRKLMRKSSFVLSNKSKADVEEADEEQKENIRPLNISSIDSMATTSQPDKEGGDPHVRKSLFRYGKPRLKGETILSLTSSSRTSLISSGYNSPISSSPVQERLQPFFTRSSSKESLSTSSDRKSYSSITQPLVGRDRERSASATTSRHASPSGISKLQVNGGAVGLFTTKNQRQRASSLLPSMSWRNKGQGTTTKLSTASNRSQLADSPKEEKMRSSLPKVDGNRFDGNAEEFVAFVLATIPRDDIAAVLASSSDDIHKKGLAHFMQRYSFAGNPLDIALRKLLMSLCLPKETQQIDRVMEAFAQRYNDCNKELFDNVDQPYVLAFSLMMLHTDAFNKNAKQKMSKLEYIRNTSSCGVPTDILEYLYDNLIFTQFIYVDDEDSLSRRKSEGEASTSFLSALSSTSNASSTRNRIDPYYIIANEQTHTLCADVDSFISKETPFTTTGTSSDIDIDRLNQSFANAPTIEIITTRRPLLPSSAAAAATVGTEAYATTTFGSVEPDEEVIVTLRVTKIGCVSRKDDIVEEDKKASSRRWKTCGMMLSSSQLLFFKDLVWTGALHHQIKEQIRTSSSREGGIVITPRLTQFKPDGVLALSDVVAVQDKSYTKYENVLRLFAKQGESYRQYLIQAASQDEMNDWIQRINFCAAFRACGLRIRGVDLPTTPSPDNDSMQRASMSLHRIGQDDTRTSLSSLLSEYKGKTSEGDAFNMSQWKLHARRGELMPKLDLIITKCAQCMSELDQKLRLAKHLAVLTPFTKITRDKIESSAISLARQIRAIRLELAKYQSRRQILELELEAGDRAAKSNTLTMSFVDVSTTEDLADESLLPLSMSMDQLSLPTPSSSFSINGSATSRSSTGSYHDSPVMTHPAPSIEHDVATPRMNSSQMSQLDDAIDVTSKPIPDREKTNEKPTSTEQQLRAAPPLRGLGLNNLIDGTIYQSDNRSNDVQNHQFNVDFKVLPSWTRTVVAPDPPQREEAERWDQSRIVRDAKRVSLATLPDTEHLMDLSRVSLLYASGAMIPDEE